MLKTFEELTKNEEWLKAIKNLKRRDTDKNIQKILKKVLTNNKQYAIIKKS